MDLHNKQYSLIMGKGRSTSQSTGRKLGPLLEIFNSTVQVHQDHPDGAWLGSVQTQESNLRSLHARRAFQTTESFPQAYKYQYYDDKM